MLAQVALVYGVYMLISRRRIAAVRAGNAEPSQFRENRDEPAESLFVRNNLANQYELPVLFYACCLSLYATGGVEPVPLVLAWLFAASRYVHAWIHVTTNRIRHRRPVFILGFFTLGAMWLWFAAHLLGLV
ncbi:MAG: MAPEG family protein [Zhengella sp.]|uniref:MAPEG family protein n=1 Tax=Zhengella sp. TaxID=2282762 RepID=UPI003529AA21